MAELIVFVDGQYSGFHTHLFNTTLDFTQLQIAGTDSGVDASTWNDKVSSFVVVSGTWRFFADSGLQGAFSNGGQPIELGPQSPGTPDAAGHTLPGHYPVLPPGFTNDHLSSVQLVRG